MQSGPQIKQQRRFPPREKNQLILWWQQIEKKNNKNSQIFKIFEAAVWVPVQTREETYFRCNCKIC